VPEEGERQVRQQSVVGVRLGEPVDYASVTANTVILESGVSAVLGKPVVAEGGRLVYFQPEARLDPGTDYRLRLEGLRSAKGVALERFELAFHTQEAVVTGGALGAAGRALPEATAPKEDPPPPPLQAPAGVTALCGNARNSATGAYLVGVSVRLDCAGRQTTGTTDTLGRFLLLNVPTGKCELETDGAGAVDGANRHGSFFHDVVIAAGRTNQLGYTVWLTPLDTLNERQVSSNVSSEQSVVSSAIPGLEVKLPPNAVIRNFQGKIINSLTLTRIPSGRTPFLVPKGVPFPLFFTVQPGGAYVEVNGSRYTPGRGAQIIYPNVQRAPAGFKYNFWNYDPENGGWKVYGTGQVSRDRKSIVPDANTVVNRFTGAMVATPDCCSSGSPVAPPQGGDTGGLPGVPASTNPPCGDCTGDLLSEYHGLGGWIETR
jgi:hypothetical protein